MRTYVVRDGKPGVYFFSLDAANPVAVWAAKKFFFLPYFPARMKSEASGDEITYDAVRLENPPAEFRAQYRPTDAIALRAEGTLEHWLSERYCLYTVKDNDVYRGEIHHARWPLQDATAEVEVNTAALAAGILLPNIPPLLHFAKRLEVLIWPLCRLSK